MSSIDAPILEAFVRELEKLAFSPRIGATLGGLGAVGGAGIAAGAGIGAGVGGIKNYLEAKREGATTGQALSAGGSGAFHGIGRGAMIGGAVGAIGGAGLGLASPGKAEAVRSALTRAPSIIGSGAQFGQRQVHGITGWRPGAPGTPIRDSLKEIGMGSHLREADVDATAARLKEVSEDPKKIGLINRMRGKTQAEVAGKAAKNLESAKDSLRAAQVAEERGLTNIPGYAKALKEDFQGQGLFHRQGALRSAARSEVSGIKGSPVSAAMMIGLPAWGAVHELRTDEDPTGQGRGRLRRAGAEVVNTAAGLALGPMPMGTQMGIMSASRHLPFPHKTPPAGHVMAPVAQDLTADSGQAVPSERVVSERAAGSAGEGSPS